MKIGRYDDAIVHYDRVLEQDGRNITALEEKGNVYYSLGRHEDAIAINPKLILLWYEKGYALRKIHRYEEAIACFDITLESSPNNVRAATAKGIALRELGKNEESLVFFFLIRHSISTP